MPNRTRRTILKAVGVAVLAVVLYFGSTGPMAYLTANGHSPAVITDFAFGVFYRPIYWACEQSETAIDLYYRWLAIWTGVKC